uniref:PUM-HD domain-containing protein n=1 Tax=Glossina brevipalpis TaxID=37001 RepID=A0A1A9WZ92_9MUSC
MIKAKKRSSDVTFNGDEFPEKKVSKIERGNGLNETTKKSSKDTKHAKSTSEIKFSRKVFNKLGSNKTLVNDKHAVIREEKTDWRKFKQDKKELRLKRKKVKDSYEICAEAKKIYEKLKNRRTGQKAELVEKLYNLFSADDILNKMVMAHDSSRIIQSMLKHAAPSLREQLSNRLLPWIADMAVSKYAHHCVLRMFNYGSPETKMKLVDAFMGNVVKLACHNISSKILDLAYLTVANAKQKSYMRQEFYSDLYKKSKDDSVKTLADTYKSASNMKTSILGAVKSNLEHVVNKNLADNSLLHTIMLEYLKECEEDKIEEIVTMCITIIPLMLTTKDGCQAAILCFYKSSTKNRRAILKTVKEHLVKICTHEHGHIFAITLLNALDDTKALKKVIYDTLHPHLETLMATQWGRRVIEWFVTPGDTSCFHPSFIAWIEEGLKYSKKDKETRRKEILEQIEESLATSIIENAEFWLSNKHIALVTAKILEKLPYKSFLKVATCLTKVVVDPNWSITAPIELKGKNKKSVGIEKIIEESTKQLRKSKQVKMKNSFEESTEKEDNDTVSVENQPEESLVKMRGIEEAGLHFVLKKILKNDKDRSAKNLDGETFGSLLIKELTTETLQKWITINRACFILLNIVENNSEDIKNQLKSLLKFNHMLLEQQKFNGAELLKKKLF